MSTGGGKLAYSVGVPTERGVYACRIPLINVIGELENKSVSDSRHYACVDKFLFWNGERWLETNRHQTYDQEVSFFLGPLPRTDRL